MACRLIARVLLLGAVLFAQQAALAHDVWHAAGGQATHDGKSPVGKQLCDLHDLLGNVLGAVNAAKLPVALLALSDACFLPVAERTAPDRALAPQSRGPPRIS